MINIIENIDLSITEQAIQIPRLFTGLAEWLFCLLFILFAPKRLSKPKLILVIIIALPLMILYQELAGRAPLQFWILGIILAVILMYLFILTTTQQSCIKTLYFTIKAFIIAEFAASFEWQIYYFYTENYQSSLLSSILFLIFTYMIVFIIIFSVEKKLQDNSMNFVIKKNDIHTIITLAILVFTISNISFLDINTPITSQYPSEIFYIRTLVDLVGIIMMYTLRSNKQMLQSKIEIAAMKNLLDKQYIKFSQSEESILLINQKYHDLKHYITIIRNEKDHDKVNEYLLQMEASIKNFELQFQTGNNVLDILLSSKNAVCLEHKINLTCVADGSQLNFISMVDLCSIFGNALDNAIESVRQIDELDMRLINIAVYSQKEFLIIRIENYFKHDLSYIEGILSTTKSNKEMHGFGVKSIKQAVSYYGGTVTIRTENNWFNLNILIPLKSK